MIYSYDIIVVGAGHAGCEAAAAAANLGSKTLLITMDKTKIGQMSCNPAIGGIAKGQIVREIDALGGYMGIVTDQSSIQFRMLNKSKGPAMWSPRAQTDKLKFVESWINIVENLPNLYIWQDTVQQILVNKSHAVYGVKTQTKLEFYAKSVILTNGTFLNGLIHIGSVQFAGGRLSEFAVSGLTEQLNSFGIRSDRMKTGTPVRVDARSINLNELTEQTGDNTFNQFSYLDNIKRTLKKLSCWTLFTNAECHTIIREGLPSSPLYNGQIQSIGPRYCPSIETKIVTFAEKDKHQLFLEPEGENTNEYYLNGFSSSLPLPIQINALKQIPAFRNIQILKPGYAIEYDFFDPTQLSHTLETKLIKNLFLAGQINGTTGYEEAAGQGLIAGINAHINCHGGQSFILNRDEAYIGVLIDDLVTKGVDEPYRMFTARAEFRTLLRQDNADSRLTEKSYKIGLADSYRNNLTKIKLQFIDDLICFFKTNSIKPVQINQGLENQGKEPISQGCKLIDLLTRPQISINDLINLLPNVKEKTSILPVNRREEILEATEIIIKYNGYIKREKQIAAKINRLENITIEGKFDFNSIQSLSIEARQKLNKIKPKTIAQASRIPGISPNDIAILLVLLGR